MNETEISTKMIVFAAVFFTCVLAGCLTMIPGFILSALGKDRIGSMLIRFGAGCGVVAFSLPMIARGGYWPIVVLVVVVFWIIWERKRKPQTSACPHCEAKFVWSKLPVILINIGSYLLIVVILLKFLEVELGNFLDIMIYITLLPMIIGYFTMKLERSD